MDNRKFSIEEVWEVLENNKPEIETEICPPRFCVDDFRVFEIAGIEFIKFPSFNGATPILSKNVLCSSVFGNTNNLSDAAEPGILSKLTADILPLIEADIGSENVLEFETDLVSLDGLTGYGTLYSKISLPTVDFIRSNADVLDNYKTEASYFTATPFSTPRHGYTRTVCFVDSGGSLGWHDCVYSNGVRPFLMLDSSIFNS